MPPADTYNSQAFPEEILRSAHKNKDSAVFDQSILLVGHGDGGGGPSPSMLESLRRMRDVDGVPKVMFGTPTQFFTALAEKRNSLPKWVGELYFELHRGTYTTQAHVKKSNRECEFFLRTAELFASIALMCTSFSSLFNYPGVDLEECWKLVCKNGFHDTLPGSSIRMVYDETAKDYAVVKERCVTIRASAKHALETKIGGWDVTKRIRTSNGSLGVAMQERNLKHSTIMLLCTAHVLTKSKTALHVIKVPKSNIGQASHVLQQPISWKLNRDCVLLAAMGMERGFGLFHVSSLVTTDNGLKSVQVSAKSGGTTRKYAMRNGIVQVELSNQGLVTSMKLACSTGSEMREVLAQGDTGQVHGNRLVLYDDVPMFWEAWDVEIYAFEKKQEIGRVIDSYIVEKGPLRGVVYFKYEGTKAGSIIEQYISLRAGSARLDFDTHVDWRESRKILRVLFETQVRAPYACYDSQFGYVRRPTTSNHSWEVAQFEVVGHQFCDLSEHNFGVALMSDCKYGYSVSDSTMRLSLLRAPKAPDDQADMGRHRFTYALMAHWGSFPNVSVLEEAADLNQPVTIEQFAVKDETNKARMRGLKMGIQLTGPVGNGAHGEHSLSCVGIACFKKAEKDDGAFVLRVYEALGGRGTAVIQFPGDFVITQARACNMLEEVDDKADEVLVIGEPTQKVQMYFKPFQVRTILLRFSQRI